MSEKDTGMGDRQKMKADAGIPDLPTDLTYDLRLAVAGEGPRAYEWSDKPHRLLYDACREVERLTALASREGWVMVPREPTNHMLYHFAGTPFDSLSPAKFVGGMYLFCAPHHRPPSR